MSLATADELDTLADALLDLDPDTLTAYLSTLTGSHLAAVETALARRHGLGWRADPSTMAAHLTRTDTLPFTAYTHTRYLAQRLVDAAEGRTPRLIINLPGRYGKTLVVLWFFVWLFDRNPSSRSIYTTYGDALAREGGVFIRDRLRENGDVLQCQLKVDRQRQDRFTTDQGGGLLAAAMGAGITGFGAGGGGVLAIDDPMKNWQEAHSEAARNKVFNSYKGTLRNRLDSEDTPIVVLHCIAAGQRVYTPAGPVPIEDVKVGDKVWAYDGTRLVPRMVEATRNEGVDDVLTITTRRGSLTVNDRHPFLVVPADGHVRPVFAPVWRKAGELVEGDLVVMGADAVGRQNAPVEGWDAPERAWLLGYLMGDGWVTAHTRRNQQGSPTSYAVCCARGVREDENERVAVGLEESFGRRPYVTSVRYWRLDCNQAGRDLTALGLTPKVGAKDKVVPPWLFSARSDTQRAFLDGLLAADGHKAKRGHGYVIGVASQELAQGAARLAALCGVRASWPRPYVQMVQAPNSDHVIESTIWRGNFVWPEHDRRGQSMVVGKIPPGVRVERVKSITDAGRAEVHDLTVAGEANFVAEGYVVHNTRWHENDLTGRLIEASEDETGEPWEVVRLPALAVPTKDRPDPLGRAEGDPLWPERFPLDDLGRRHLALGSYLTAALEQQEPAPEEGTELLREWFRLDETLPTKPDEQITSWDLKMKDKEAGDYVVGQLWWRVGVDYWLMDQVRGRYDHATTANAIALLAVRHPTCAAHVIESAGAAEEVTAMLEHPEPGYVVTPEMAGRLGMNDDEAEAVALLRRRGMSGLIPHRPEGDKSVRARTYIAPVAESGHVHLPGHASFVPALLDELAAFPTGTHDDQVDAMSQALQRFRTPVEDVPVAAPGGGRNTPLRG